jgi:hypothetical protein
MKTETELPNQTLARMNTEEIVWDRFDQVTPPKSVCLFVRLVDEQNVVNFATAIWDGNRLWYWNLLGQDVQFPDWLKPTHWTMSEAANKTWFRYRWDNSIDTRTLRINPNEEQIL